MACISNGSLCGAQIPSLGARRVRAVKVSATEENTRARNARKLGERAQAADVIMPQRMTAVKTFDRTDRTRFARGGPKVLRMVVWQCATVRAGMCTIPDSYGLAEAFFTDKLPTVFTLTAFPSPMLECKCLITIRP